MLRLIPVVAVLIIIAFLQNTTFCDDESNTRKTFGTASVIHPYISSDLPVIQYRCSRFHHIGAPLLNSGTNIDRIYFWENGMVAWSIVPSPERLYEILWYQATIPVEKIETAVREITDSFAKYPAKNRQIRTFITIRLGANYSPHIDINSSQHFESFGMDNDLMEFYIKNRETFQSGNEEAILETIRAVRGGLPPGTTSPDGSYIGPHPAYMFNFKHLVGYYRREYPQAELAEIGTTVYSDEELLKCAALYTADVEHLLFAEKRILDLLPSTKGLTPKNLKMEGHYFRIESETKGDETEFFYRPITEEEWKRIMGIPVPVR